MFKHVDRLKSWLDEFRPLPTAVVSELKHRYEVRFTYNSNAIEGNTLTQRETEMVLEHGITIGGKKLVEHLEVIGHRDAIAFIQELVQSKTLVRAYEIRQIHALLMHSVDRNQAGQYRSVSVQSAGAGYVYPAPNLIDSLMADFVDWLQRSSKSLHPVEFAAEAHLRLVTIHPFQDGNGRTARLLMNLLLLKAGYPIAIISNAIRSDYIDAIVAAQQENVGSSLFLAILANAVEESLIEVLEAAASTVDPRSLPDELKTFLMTK